MLLLQTVDSSENFGATNKLLMNETRFVFADKFNVSQLNVKTSPKKETHSVRNVVIISESSAEKRKNVKINDS